MFLSTWPKRALSCGQNAGSFGTPKLTAQGVDGYLGLGDQAVELGEQLKLRRLLAVAGLLGGVPDLQRVEHERSRSEATAVTAEIFSR